MFLFKGSELYEKLAQDHTSWPWKGSFLNFWKVIGILLSCCLPVLFTCCPAYQHTSCCWVMILLVLSIRPCLRTASQCTDKAVSEPGQVPALRPGFSMHWDTGALDTHHTTIHLTQEAATEESVSSKKVEGSWKAEKLYVETEGGPAGAWHPFKNPRVFTARFLMQKRMETSSRLRSFLSLERGLQCDPFYKAAHASLRQLVFAGWIWTKLKARWRHKIQKLYL